MIKFPKIKKNITGFIVSEEGQISKSSLVGMGVLFTGLGINVASAAHTSTIGCGISGGNVNADHSSSHSNSGTTDTTTTDTTTTAPTTTDTTDTTTTSTTDTTTTDHNQHCQHSAHDNCGTTCHGNCENRGIRHSDNEQCDNCGNHSNKCVSCSC